MFISVTKTFKGQERGKSVQKYIAGETYNIEDDKLLKVVFDQNWGVEDVFASMVSTGTPEQASEAEEKEYGLTELDILGLPMKQLKAIIAEESFTIDAQGKKQSELAAAVVESLKLKYKGI